MKSQYDNVWGVKSSRSGARDAVAELSCVLTAVIGSEVFSATNNTNKHECNAHLFVEIRVIRGFPRWLIRFAERERFCRTGTLFTAPRERRPPEKPEDLIR